MRSLLQKTRLTGLPRQIASLNSMSKETVSLLILATTSSPATNSRRKKCARGTCGDERGLEDSIEGGAFIHHSHPKTSPAHKSHRMTRARSVHFCLAHPPAPGAFFHQMEVRVCPHQKTKEVGLHKEIQSP